MKRKVQHKLISENVTQILKINAMQRGLESDKKPNNIVVISWLKYFWPLLLIFFAWWLTTQVGYAVNVTHSFPQKVWLIVYHQKPARGDYVLFKAPANSGVDGTPVIKQIIGVPGDSITRVNQDFFINSEYILTAKKHSLQGEPLKPGPSGVLPDKHYYVASHHKDSFDSRYEKMGWIAQSQIIGVAYPLW
jgi:conjugal transfer pilin signal peptidase TrbI